MNDIRQLAMSCTVKKIGYRQSNAGNTVTFLLHPEDEPGKLARDHLGTMYGISLVEIDENDKAKPLLPQPAKKQPAPVSEPLPGRVAAVQRAGRLCHERGFQRFLIDRQIALWRLTSVSIPDDERAAETVRKYLRVKSRAEIKTNDEAFARWSELDAQYQAWFRS